MKFVDTHSHLFLPEFDLDRKRVVEDAIRAGVSRMILPNVDRGTIEPMLSLAGSYPENCFPAIGLHPGSVQADFLSELNHVEELLKNEKFYAIGETGIDLYWDASRKEEQMESFRQQIGMAKRFGLPIIIHARNSFDEIVSILNVENNDSLNGVFHAFTGDSNQARKIIDFGFMIGIGGILTFKNSGLDEVCKKIPPRHIVLETDSPYLSPVPKRGKRNESAYLIHIAEKLADLQNLSIGEISAITTQNALRLFSLSENQS